MHDLSTGKLTALQSNFSFQGRGHLSRSTSCPAPSRQGESFNFSRQVCTHTTVLSIRSATDRLEAPNFLDWSIVPADEFTGVWIPLDSWVFGFPRFLGVWIPSGFPGCLDSSGFLDVAMMAQLAVELPLGVFEAHQHEPEKVFPELCNN